MAELSDQARLRRELRQTTFRRLGSPAVAPKLASGRESIAGAVAWLRHGSLGRVVLRERIRIGEEASSATSPEKTKQYQ